MLKSILNLDGAQSLTKNDQKEISGGLHARFERVCSLCGVQDGEFYYSDKKWCEPGIFVSCDKY